MPFKTALLGDKKGHPIKPECSEMDNYDKKKMSEYLSPKKRSQYTGDHTSLITNIICETLIFLTGGHFKPSQFYDKEVIQK